MEIHDLHLHIMSKIQGVFSELDMEVLSREIEKLKPGQVYLEIGVNEGRSFRTAYEYAPEGVYVMGIDIKDVYPNEASIGRGEFFEQEEMVGIGKRGFYIHGDADEFAEKFLADVNLLFIDGHHDYESVKKNTLKWEGNVPRGGVILFHDYDHEDTKRWLDEHYGDNKEILHGKIVRVVK